MARMRTLKPSAFRSLTLSQVEIAARWTFAGLWTECDDAGIAVWDARLLKAAIYPLDETVTLELITDHMAQLERVGAVHFYSVAGRQYVHVPSFSDHQHPNRPTKSELPRCPENTDEANTHCAHIAGSVSTHGALTPVLSCLVEGLARSDSDEQSPRTSASPTPRAANRKTKTPPPDDFEVTLPLRSWAKEHGITCNLTTETQQFLDYHRGKGSRQLDWTATWRGWMRNTLKYGSTAPTKPTQGGGW